jgi:hypothetical protein
MADLNQKEVPDTKQSNPEAQSRINEVVTKAIQIIENNPKIGEILRESLKKNILDAILKNPMMVQSVLDEVDHRFKMRLDNMPASERLKAIKWYADLTEQLGHDIAAKTLNIPLDNAINSARAQLNVKTESLRNTYKALEKSLKEEIRNHNLTNGRIIIA